MYVELEPDTHIEFIKGVGTAQDIHSAAKAMFASVEYLEAFGGEVNKEPSEGDKHEARAVVMGKAPLDTIKSSASARHLMTVLDEYDHQVVESFSQLRQFIVNRLVEEAQPGQRQAIRALELLGKVSGVDLFVERHEVTVKTRTTSELQMLVRQKLARISSNAEIIDVPVQNSAPEPELVEPDVDPIDEIAEVLDDLTS